MVLEIYYLDYKTAIDQTNELDYVNRSVQDKSNAKTTMNSGLLYTQDGSVGGHVEIISFIREKNDYNTVTSLFSLFTNNGILNFNVVKKYDSNYNPASDVVISFSNYASGSYFNGNPVIMKIEPVGNYPDIAFKISLIY